jgi:secreted trypsin-like serine protease
MNTESTLTKSVIILTALSTLFLFGACAEFEEEEELNSVDKVIGGSVVRNAPDHVGVLLVGSTELNSTCTVTLIDNDSVLTAAHCWGGNDDERDVMEQAVDLGLVYVCLGDRDWGKKRGLYCSKGELAQVTDFKIHPNYKNDPNRHDVSVAQLGTSFPNLSKPQLASRRQHTSGNTQSYGYGLKKTRVLSIDSESGDVKVQNEGKVDSKLRVLNRTTLSTADCNQEIDSLNVSWEGVNESNICLNVNKRNNLCHGDSGGPTFINGRLAGVTSRGTANVNTQRGTLSTCDGSGPTILMNVHKFRSWIRQNIR